MSKLKTVTSILAKMFNVKPKELHKDTEIYLFHSISINKQGSPSSIYLNNKDSNKFLRKIEKKYGIFFPGNESSNFIDIEGVVKNIKAKKFNIKQQKKIGKTDISDFVFFKHIETLRIGDRGTTINVIGSGPVGLTSGFWYDFDKWYAANRKKILKKVRFQNTTKDNTAISQTTA